MENGTTLDQRIDKIAKGREASLMAGLLKPLIDRKISENVLGLVAQYRSENLHHDLMIGRVAAISTLMGLMSELEAVHKQGLNALEREVKNA